MWVGAGDCQVENTADQYVQNKQISSHLGNGPPLMQTMGRSIDRTSVIKRNRQRQSTPLTRA